MSRSEAGTDVVAAPQPPTRNSILAALPRAEYQALAPELEWVQVPSGVYLDEFGGPAEHVYFPTQGVVSLLYASEAGESSLVALVGSEGMASVSAFMAGGAPHLRALASTPCPAYRAPARRLQARFVAGGVLQQLLLAYAGGLLLEVSVSAHCNRHHTLEKQLCRWLLQWLDRVPGDELHVTQELIAYQLGVRRQGVTEAVSRLEEQNLIVSARGRITVRSHAGLLARACDCYDVLRAPTQRPEGIGMRPLVVASPRGSR